MNPDGVALLELLDCLGRLIRGDLRARGGANRLQPVHLQALVYLRQANRYSNTPLALAEYLGSTKGTVSQSLLVLHRQGLLERYADEHDRRVVRLRLSRRGEALLADDGLAGVWGEAVGGLAAAEVATARQVLQEVLRNLQQARGSRSFGACHTCAHFRREGPTAFRCGLTGEALSAEDSQRICREHAWPA